MPNAAELRRAWRHPRRYATQAAETEGHWVTIGGNPVFIAGPAIDEGSHTRTKDALRADYSPPVSSRLADPKIREQAIAMAEEHLTYSNIVGLGLALRFRAREMFTGELPAGGIGIPNTDAFIKQMERNFLPAGVQSADLIKTMYAETQKTLKKEGTAELTVYRGTNNPTVLKAMQSKTKKAVDITVDMRGFSSWSRSSYEAARFGSAVIEAKVPASMVWSIPSHFYGEDGSVPSFLMPSGPRRLEEEVILAPTQKVVGTVSRAKEYR